MNKKTELILLDILYLIFIMIAILWFVGIVMIALKVI